MKTHSLNVLIADDDPAVLATLSKALELRGHQVSCATSAEQVHENADQDVVVCDLGLGEDDGIELCSALRKRGCKARFILIAGKLELEDMRRALHLGAADVLEKPFDLSELYEAVEDTLSTCTAATETGPETYRREYRAVSGAMEEAARDLSAYLMRCGVSPSSRTRVASACAEGFDNVVNHAYPGLAGQLVVEASIDEREIHVSITDSGVGFDACEVTNSAFDSNSGIGRATSLAESVHVDSTIGAGTRMSLSFSAYRVLFEEESRVDLTELDFLTPRTSRRVLESLADEELGDLFHLSPALAVSVGRMLAGPNPRRLLENTLWS